jgi:hypothetical protein
MFEGLLLDDDSVVASRDVLFGLPGSSPTEAPDEKKSPYLMRPKTPPEPTAF